MWFTQDRDQLCSACYDTKDALSGRIPFVPLIPAVGETHQDRFESFDRANPWVYDALVDLTRDLVHRGRKRVGIKMLFEVLRWEYERSTVGDSEFKLNNNFHSRYARKIMGSEPDLEGVFEVRELKAA